MEALKAVLLNLPRVNVKEYIFESDEFKKIRQKIEKFVRSELKAENIGPSQRDEVSRKLTELSRRPFKHVLLEIFAYIGLSTDEQELSLFVKCRDSLVHQGRFYCETATLDDRQRMEPLNSAVEEYFFLVN